MTRNFQIGKWLQREIFIKSLTSVWGVLFLAVLSLSITYLVYAQHFFIVVAMIGGIIGTLVLYIIFFRPLIGFYLVSVMSVFAFYPQYILHVELGIPTLVEVLFWILLLASMRITPAKGMKNDLMSSPITIIFLICTLYNLLQFFNLDLKVRTVYYLAIRRFIMFLWIFIIAYRLIDTPGKFKFFIKFLIFIGFLAAAYGCYQQWFGFLPPELSYVMNNPVLYGLNFQGGQLRKFSFMSDVSQFGIFAGSICVLTLVIAINEKQRRRKLVLFIASIVMALGMSYSGTRTATYTIPVGLSLYILMTIQNKKTLITIFSFIVVIIFILFAPIYTNKTLNRLRSSFEMGDASLNVRDVNRHMIQPYIYSHPFGGGIGMTGAKGQSLDPTHPLGDFPPDSGLLKIAVETGWMGLVLEMLWYMVIMYFFIHTIFSLRNPRYKTYAIGLVCALLSIIVSQYSQVVIGQIPMVVFYMASIAIIKRLPEFEKLEMHPENNRKSHKFVR